MEDKRKIKIGIAAMASIVILFSGFEPFAFFNMINLTMTTFQIKGFIVVLTASIIYIYSISRKKKTLSLISTLLIIIGYGITIYAMIVAKLELSELGIGCYLYFSAIILLGISYVMPNGDEFVLTEEMIEKGKLAEETGNIEGSFIICNYITGIKNAQNIYKSMSILIKKNNSNTLDVNIKAPEEIKMSIEDSSIEKKIISKSLITHVSEVEKEDNTTDTQYLATVLVGSFGPLIGQQLAKDRSASTKTTFNVYYKIEIKYKNEEESRLVFHTNDDPSEFFKNYENILEIID